MQRNKARIHTTLLSLVLAAGAALLLAGCNPGGVGIFYTLENETLQTSTSVIGNDRTIGSMAMVSGSPGAYYIGAGNLYTSSAGSSLSWKQVGESGVTVPNAICNQIAAVGSTLYAVFFDPNGSESALYSASVTGADTNPSWAAVSGFDATSAKNGNFTVQSVFIVNAQLLVSTQTTSSSGVTYSLYLESSPGSALLSGLLSPITAGSFDGSNYWFVSGDALYTGAALSSLAVAGGTPSLSTTETYNGIYWSGSPLNTLFVSTSLGNVYTHTSGGWNTSNIASWPSNVAQTALNGFTEVTVGSTDAIMIGSAVGYYEWDIPSTSTSIGKTTLGRPGNTTTTTATVNYVSSNLASALILGFFNDAATNRVFALTGGDGLWLNEPNSSGQRAWTQE